MQNLELPHDLTNEERDAALLQLLSKERGTTYFLKPPTEMGATIAKNFGEMLHSDVATGRIQKAISDATDVAECSIGNALNLLSSAAHHKVSNEIEHALSYKVLTVFEAAHQELALKMHGESDFQPLSDADSWIGNPANSSAFADLMSEIEDSLPKLVHASVSWVFDGHVIDEGLSNIVDSFIDDHVVPIVVDSFSTLRSIELNPVTCNIEKSGGDFNG
ncbi:hypothetical protein [Ascidiaceihabitans sp.]|uniref:hypothetical protein n=1 Tax=Ascidiaceihabitans sp. TaxID=1872644 RepID=UPI0032977A79